MTKNPIPSDTPKSPTEPEDVHLSDTAEAVEKPALSPAAERALAEADARRKAHDMEAGATEKEVGGRGGADPARFGDWEINGRAIDF